MFYQHFSSMTKLPVSFGSTCGGLVDKIGPVDLYTAIHKKLTAYSQSCALLRQSSYGYNGNLSA